MNRQYLAALMSLFLVSNSLAGMKVDTSETEIGIKNIQKRLKTEKKKKQQEEWNRAIENSGKELQNGTCMITEGCYDIIKQEGNTIHIICRTDGRNGVENKVCMNKDGKWANGCGFSDVFAYHYRSADKAAKAVCGL